jgi:hypothetical protein
MPSVALAQSAGQGLEISPPLKEISAKPGQTVTFTIKVRNVTTSTLVATASVEDFVAKDETGDPKLLIGPNAEPSPYSVRDWVQSIGEITLPPQKIQEAVITLKVPQSASPGGHYGVIRFSAVPPELKDSGVSLSASIGALVLVNVAGNVVNKASFVEFFTTQNDQNKSFFEAGPITFVERIRNEGNVHFKPAGIVKITSMFGKPVATLNINEKGGNVLPASVRRFEQQLDKKYLFGRYTAKAEVDYNGKKLSKSTSFWVIPYKQIAIALGILLLLIILLTAGLKRYNRHIISRANRNK